MITCHVTRKGRFSEYFSEEDVQRIRSYNLDFIVRFGFGIVRGEIHGAARYGIWSYHHDDERVYRGSPPCFWPIYDNRPTSGAVLQRLTDRLDGGVILRHGTFATQPSYSTNLKTVYGGCVDWIRSAALQVKLGDLITVSAQPSPTTARISYSPGPISMLNFLGRGVFRTVLRQFRRLLYHDIWNVGLLRESPESLLENGFTRPVEWAPTPPSGRYSLIRLSWKRRVCE